MTLTQEYISSVNEKLVVARAYHARALAELATLADNIQVTKLRESARVLDQAITELQAALDAEVGGAA